MTIECQLADGRREEAALRFRGHGTGPSEWQREDCGQGGMVAAARKGA